MWAHLSRIAIIAVAAPPELTAQQYTAARAVFQDTVIALRGVSASDVVDTAVRVGRGHVPPRPGTAP